MAKRTEMLDVHGKVKYIHAVNVSKYGDWNIVLIPDAASLEIIRDLQAQGLRNVLKKDDDGYYIQFRRETQKLIKGSMVAFAAPRIVDRNAVPINGNTVGWGSDVTVRLELRWVTPPNQTKQVPACRWDSLRVNELVPYDPDKTIKDPSEDHKAIEKNKELAKAPAPLDNPW